MPLLICNWNNRLSCRKNIDKIMLLQDALTILIGIASTELIIECVPNLSRARFDYKRKDEDDMAKSTKTYEERIRALEKRNRESIEATKKPHCTAKGTGKEERKPRRVKNEPIGSVRLAVRWNRFLAVRLRRRFTKVDRL